MSAVENRGLYSIRRNNFIIIYVVDWLLQYDSLRHH